MNVNDAVSGGMIDAIAGCASVALVFSDVVRMRRVMGLHVAQTAIVQKFLSQRSELLMNLS